MTTDPDALELVGRVREWARQLGGVNNAEFDPVGAKLLYEVVVALQHCSRAAEARREVAREIEIPQDVVRLVIAARHVMDAEADAQSMRNLDKAAEQFASRVPWEDQPE